MSVYTPPTYKKKGPPYHLVLAQNRLDAANIWYKYYHTIAGTRFDLFIPGRCLLIDIEPSIKDRISKQKIATAIGLTYRAISKRDATSIDKLVKFLPIPEDYRAINERALETASRLVNAWKTKKQWNIAKS